MKASVPQYVLTLVVFKSPQDTQYFNPWVCVLTDVTVLTFLLVYCSTYLYLVVCTGHSVYCTYLCLAVSTVSTVVHTCAWL